MKKETYTTYTTICELNTKFHFDLKKKPQKNLVFKKTIKISRIQMLSDTNTTTEECATRSQSYADIFTLSLAHLFISDKWTILQL